MNEWNEISGSTNIKFHEVRNLDTHANDDKKLEL